jgi:hypothetical protein
MFKVKLDLLSKNYTPSRIQLGLNIKVFTQTQSCLFILYIMVCYLFIFYDFCVAFSDGIYSYIHLKGLYQCCMEGIYYVWNIFAILFLNGSYLYFVLAIPTTACHLHMIVILRNFSFLQKNG